ERGKPRVAIAERREVEGQIWQRPPAVPELEGEHLLGVEVTVAEEEDHGVSGRVGRGDVHVALEPGRHPYGARYRAPERLAVREIPGRAHARLHLEAAEVVVLELGADSQPHGVRQRDLVLHEPAGEIVPRGGRAQLK